MNEHFFKPINKKIKCTSIIGLAASGALLLAIFFFAIFWRDCPACPVFHVLIFGVYIIISLIYGCLNISNFNELANKGRNDNNLARKINIVIVSIGFVLLPYTIFLLVYISNLREKWKYCSWNKFNKEERSIPNTTTY